MKGATKRKYNLAWVNPKEAAKVLRVIAGTLEEQETLDGTFRALCGPDYDGKTDFRMLQQTNEWAARVRKHYAAGIAFSRIVRQWLLKTANIKTLDTVRALAGDADGCLVALKSKIAADADDVPPELSVTTYCDNIKDQAEKLKELQQSLTDLAADKQITFAKIAGDLVRLQHAEELRAAADQDSVAQQFFGEAYQGIETDITAIADTADFIKRCLAVPALGKAFDTFLKQDFATTWQHFTENLHALTDTIKKARDQAIAVDDLASTGFGNPPANNDWQAADLNRLITQLQDALTRSGALNQWVSFKRYYANAAKNITGRLLQAYDQENCDWETLPDAFEYMVYRAIAREIYRLHSLNAFNGMSLQQARDKIKTLNQQIIACQQQVLCNQLNVARPLPGERWGKKGTWTEDALIHNEINKQRAYIPIRRLMERAGKSIQKIKPCFLMSPLTVAQYLDHKFTFDLVVIDEASQMRPEDALGGIARAQQIIVVGDPQQLPPSAFFQSTESDEEAEDTIDDAIMDMALSAFRPPRMLSRHYRSQHESLIAFSNYHFYDKRLVLFPSPVKKPDTLGVRLEYVGGTYVARSNIKEVEEVVKAA